MITERDLEVVKFVNEFGAAKTSVLENLFYPSYRVAAKRLSELVKADALHRGRTQWATGYYYYKQKPKDIRRTLLLTDFYCEFKKVVQIETFIKNPELNSVCSEAKVEYLIGDENHTALIEIVFPGDKFNYSMYETFDWQRYFPTPPELIIISDEEYSSEQYKIINISTDLDLSPLVN